MYYSTLKYIYTYIHVHIHPKLISDHYMVLSVGGLLRSKSGGNDDAHHHYQRSICGGLYHIFTIRSHSDLEICCRRENAFIRKLLKSPNGMEFIKKKLPRIINPEHQGRRGLLFYNGQKKYV